MDSAKNLRRIISFKKFGMVRVNTYLWWKYSCCKLDLQHVCSFSSFISYINHKVKCKYFKVFSEKLGKLLDCASHCKLGNSIIKMTTSQIQSNLSRKVTQETGFGLYRQVVCIWRFLCFISSVKSYQSVAFTYP